MSIDIRPATDFPIRPGQTPLAIVRRAGRGRIRLALFLPDGRLASQQIIDPAPDATAGIAFDIPADTMAGHARFIAELLTGPERVAARFPIESATPTRPIWRYRQRFSIGDAADLQWLDLTALVPRAIPLKLAIHPPAPPANSTDDVYGNRWVHARFTADDLMAAGTREAAPTPSGRGTRAVPILTREFDLLSFSLTGHLPALSLDPALAAGTTIALPAHLQPFVQPEPHIESDAPAVMELAADVPAITDAGPLAVAARAFAVVRRHLKYQLQPGEYGARFAAETKIGDCTEFAALFAALCRARGVPARVAAGVFGDDCKVAHAIAEIYLNGMWFPLDPTQRREFHLGMPAAFVPMMRANWMDAERAYQPYRLTTITTGQAPRLVFAETYRRQDAPAHVAAPTFRIRSAPEIGGEVGSTGRSGMAAVGGAWMGGEFVRAMADAPTMVVEVAPPDSLAITVRNPGRLAWRTVLVVAVEPDAPVVVAVCEIKLPPHSAPRIEFPYPHAMPDLFGTRGLLVALLTGEKIIAASRHATD